MSRKSGQPPTPLDPLLCFSPTMALALATDSSLVELYTYSDPPSPTLSPQPDEPLPPHQNQGSITTLELPNVLSPPSQFSPSSDSKPPSEPTYSSTSTVEEVGTSPAEERIEEDVSGESFVYVSSVTARSTSTVQDSEGDQGKGLEERLVEDESSKQEERESDQPGQTSTAPTTTKRALKVETAEFKGRSVYSSGSSASITTSESGFLARSVTLGPFSFILPEFSRQLPPHFRRSPLPTDPKRSLLFHLLFLHAPVQLHLPFPFEPSPPTGLPSSPFLSTTPALAGETKSEAQRTSSQPSLLALLLLPSSNLKGEDPSPSSILVSHITTGPRTIRCHLHLHLQERCRRKEVGTLLVRCPSVDLPFRTRWLRRGSWRLRTG